MEISPEQAQELARVAERHGLRLIVAFGSRMTGRSHAGSDLDLAVLPKPGKSISMRFSEYQPYLQREAQAARALIRWLRHAG